MFEISKIRTLDLRPVRGKEYWNWPKPPRFSVPQIIFEFKVSDTLTPSMIEAQRLIYESYTKRGVQV